VTLFPFWIIWDFVASSVASILVLQLVNFAIITVATGVLTAAIHDICVGNRPTIAHSFSFANERFGNLLGVSLLETLIISLGLVLLIVPGIILWAFYLFSASVVIVDGCSPREALKESRRLMSGNFWKCTAVYAPLWFLSGAVQIGSIFLIEAEEPTVVQSLLANFIAICFVPPPQIAAVLMYYDMKACKDGRDIRPLFADLT